MWRSFPRSLSMSSRILFNCAFLLLLPPLIYAQNVEWATKVVSYSSQYSETANSAEQILGKPNALPGEGDSPVAWAVGKGDEEGNESTEEATIKVGFATPM